MDVKNVKMHIDDKTATVTLKPSSEQGMFTGRENGGVVAGSEVSVWVPRSMAQALLAGEVDVLADSLDRSSDDGSVRVDLQTLVYLRDPARIGLHRLDNNTFTEVEPVSQPLAVAIEPDNFEKVSWLDGRSIVPVLPQ